MSSFYLLLFCFLSPNIWRLITVILVDENPYQLTPDQIEVAELGKPRLGEFKQTQITVKESKEFQVCNLFLTDQSDPLSLKIK